MLSYDLERKEAFHDDKNVNSSKFKKCFFSKVLEKNVNSSKFKKWVFSMVFKKSNIFFSLLLGKIR